MRIHRYPGSTLVGFLTNPSVWCNLETVLRNLEMFELFPRPRYRLFTQYTGMELIKYFPIFIYHYLHKKKYQEIMIGHHTAKST